MLHALVNTQQMPTFLVFLLFSLCIERPIFSWIHMTRKDAKDHWNYKFFFCLFLRVFWLFYYAFCFLTIFYTRSNIEFPLIQHDNYENIKSPIGSSFNFFYSIDIFGVHCVIKMKKKTFLGRSTWWFINLESSLC